MPNWGKEQLIFKFSGEKVKSPCWSCYTLIDSCTLSLKLPNLVHWEIPQGILAKLIKSINLTTFSQKYTSCHGYFVSGRKL